MTSANPPLDGLPVVTKSGPGGVPASRLREAADRLAHERVHRVPDDVLPFDGAGELVLGARFHIWSLGGCRPGDRYLTINLNPRTAWKKRLQDVVLRSAYMTFNADNQD